MSFIQVVNIYKIVLWGPKNLTTDFLKYKPNLFAPLILVPRMARQNQDGRAESSQIEKQCELQWWIMVRCVGQV
jgi:hypothetical protein